MVRVVIRPWPRSVCAVGDRGVGPGQRVERGEQAGLVVLDGEHEPRAALVQVGGVVTLAVEGVGGDDQPGRVDAGGGQLVDQRGEHGDLVGLRADLDLAEYELVTMGGRGQQVHLGAVGGDRAAHRLPVHRDREQRPIGLLRLVDAVCAVGGVGVGFSYGGGRPGSGRRVSCLLGQPGADRRIDRGGVDTGQDPPQRRLRRPPGRARDGEYNQASSSAGTSATQPAIAVNERIPASTAAAHNVNTTATG